MQTVRPVLLSSLLVVGLTGCAVEPAQTAYADTIFTDYDAAAPYLPDATIDVGDVDPGGGSSAPGRDVRLRTAPEVVDACDHDALSEDQFLVAADVDRGEAGALHALARCLESGALSDYELELVGSTELPGALMYPAMGGGDADRIRNALAGLDVPFSRVRTTRPGEAKGMAAVGTRPASVYVRIVGRDC